MVKTTLYQEYSLDRAKFFYFLDWLILIFLSIFLFAENSQRMGAIRNITLYGALAFLIWQLCLNKARLISNFKSNFQNNKIILILFLLFLTYVFVVSIFAYTPLFESLYWLMHDNKRFFIFFIIIMFWYDANPQKSKIIFFAMATVLILTSMQFLIAVFNDMELIKENFKNINFRIVPREYMWFVDILFSYSFVGFVITKNKTYKIILALFAFFIAPAMLILTGARGAWLAYLASGFFILLFLARGNLINKKTLKFIGYFTILVCIICGALFYSVPLIKYKITQGIDTSGRDVIIKTRLPILFKSDRFFWGLGYGDITYWRFINDKNTENRNLGSSWGKYDYDNYWKFKNKIGLVDEASKVQWEEQSSKITKWSRDEPFAIKYFYNFGFIGIALLFGVVFVLLFGSIKRYLRQKNPYYLALFGSCFSVCVVHGMFDNNLLDDVFYMICFYIIFNYKEEKCQKLV